MPTRILRDYRDSLRRLEEYRKANFQAHTKVIVNAPQYKGPGITTVEDATRPDQVAVRLGNGNVWWYPIECVRRVET